MFTVSFKQQNCSERMAVMNPKNNQIITLGSWCETQTIKGVQTYNCTDERRFIAARERWWYIAAAHCRPATVSCEGGKNYRKHPWIFCLFAACYAPMDLCRLLVFCFCTWFMSATYFCTQLFMFSHCKSFFFKFIFEIDSFIFQQDEIFFAVSIVDVNLYLLKRIDIKTLRDLSEAKV